MLGLQCPAKKTPLRLCQEGRLRQDRCQCITGRPTRPINVPSTNPRATGHHEPNSVHGTSLTLEQAGLDPIGNPPAHSELPPRPSSISRLTSQLKALPNKKQALTRCAGQGVPSPPGAFVVKPFQFFREQHTLRRASRLSHSSTAPCPTPPYQLPATHMPPMIHPCVVHPLDRWLVSRTLYRLSQGGLPSAFLPQQASIVLPRVPYQKLQWSNGDGATSCFAPRDILPSISPFNNCSLFTRLFFLHGNDFPMEHPT